MQVVNVTVVLLGYPAGQQLQVPDRSFYQQLFFNQYDGLAAYWLKQTDNQVLFDGQVIEWAWINDPSPNLAQRRDVINAAISDMESDRGISFASTDVVIVVLGAPANVPSDGGSTIANSLFRTHHGIVARVGDRFDFFAHELGHSLGLHIRLAITRSNKPGPRMANTVTPIAS